MAKSRKAIKAKLTKKAPSVKLKKKAGNKKPVAKRNIKTKNFVKAVFAIQTVGELVDSLKYTLEKEVLQLNKQIQKLEPKLEKIIAKKDKEWEKASALKEKIGEIPKVRDKKDLKKMQASVNVLIKQSNKAQNEISTLETQTKTREQEINRLAVLQEAIAKIESETMHDKSINNRKSKEKAEAQKAQVLTMAGEHHEEHPNVIIY